MTEIHTLNSPDKRYDEASLWIERLSEGLTVREQAELTEWMAADRANRDLLFTMAQLWDKMDTLSQLSMLFPEPFEKRGTNLWPGYALAASVLVVFAVLLVWVTSFRGAPTEVDELAFVKPTESIYETAIGEQKNIVLDDGSHLVINTHSRVRVRFTPEYRTLILETGEIHVQVAEDLHRPLSVFAGNNIVQAVGTAFNIEMISNRRIELVVTEGKVRVGVHPQPASNVVLDRTAPVLAADATIVTAGQELLIGSPEQEISPISEADIEVKLSWRKGNLIFSGESLEETVAEVERYTGVEFVIVDEDLKRIRVSGFFKAGDVNGMLAVLKENFDIAYQRVDEHRVLLYAF